MYFFIKMSEQWYGLEIEDIESDLENLQEHVNNGDIVHLADDIEYFADDMGIDVAEIEILQGLEC